MGDRCCNIIGCYLAPGDGATIRGVETAMAERLRGTELIVAGDLNVDIERTVGRGQDEDIATAVATAGLEDILAHFLLQRRAWNRDRRMWAVMKQGREVRSRTDYILRSDHWIF